MSVAFISDYPELKLVAGHDRPPQKDGSGVVVDKGTFHKDLPPPNMVIEFLPHEIASGTEESGNLIVRQVGVAELTDEREIRMAERAAGHRPVTIDSDGVLHTGAPDCRRMPPDWRVLRRLELARTRKDLVVNKPGVVDAGD